MPRGISLPEGHCPLGIANQSVPIAALSLELDLEIELHRYVTIVLDPRPCIALDPVSLRNLGIGTIPAIDKDGRKMLTYGSSLERDRDGMEVRSYASHS